jgi:phosphoglycolate phosphatase-like HAD superfamily hydrolase
MNIHKYFREIYGSPKPKTQLVKELLTNNQYIGNTCLLIGDSINDYDAAFNNGVQFMAYNNALIKDRTTFSIALD